MKKFFFAAILLLLPIQTWAVCSAENYTVIYVNGIFTSEGQAEMEKKDLQDKFSFFSGRSDVTFIKGYNPSHIGGAGDLVKSILQAYQNEDAYINDYDLQTILLTLEPEVKTRKILLFGYSQGTFYTNALYKYLVANGVPKESIAVYNVGTPASHVAGNGKYITSGNDTLINKVREATAFGSAKQPLVANILIPPVAEDATSRYPGHSLKNVYLPKQTSRIISDVNNALNSLVASAPSNGGCFSPPPVGMDYNLKKAAFAFGDVTGQATITGINLAYQGASATLATLQKGVDFIAGGIRSLLPPANMETARAGFDVVRNVYGSSLSEEDLEELHGVSKQGAAVIAAKSPIESSIVEPASQETPLVEEAPSAPKPEGQVLGDFIQAIPSFLPTTPNGPLIGGGGGGSAPAPEPVTAPEPVPEPAETPEPELAPVSMLSISSPTDGEIIATTTITVSGIAPAETLVEISSGATTTTTVSDANGGWNTEMILTEGAISISVSAFENDLQATTTLSKNFTITLPCVVPTSSISGEVFGLNETWTAAHGPYVIDGDAYIRDGSITFEPGTVVKLMPNATLILHPNVTIIVAGSEDAPVVFTSIKDDAWGGDTNCDGSSTTPAPGDFGYVSFGHGYTKLSLGNFIVMYGGGRELGTINDGPMYPSVTVSYPTFFGLPPGVYTLSGAEVAHSAGTGLYVSVGRMSSVTISDSSFYGNATHGLYRQKILDAGGNAVAGAVILENNWWGDATGPYHETLNPTGLGNAVAPSPSQYETIDFNPWLTVAP